MGLSPDVIVCRSTEELSTATKNKMSIFCQVPPENIISVYDVSNIYHVPLILVEQKLDHILRNALDLVDGYPALDMQQWAEMAKVVDNLSIPVDIAIVGKYVGLHDSYLSLIKALKHSAIHLKLDVRLNWVEATNLEEDTKIKDPDAYKAAWETIRKVKGILVPGGFGIRGVAGKVAVVKYARENKIPLLGVCLGMQVMVIEYARSMLGWNDANSTEFSEQTGSPVVIFMPDINPNIMGGTMRLGSRKTIISTTLDDGKLSLGSEVYGYLETDVSRKTISERHRHRYEVNPEKVDALEKRGLVFSGRDETGQRMEIVELPRSVHPFFFGTQFHPEFRSRPNRPSPPFFAFVAASAGKELTKTEWSTAGKMWIEHELKIYRDIGSAASPVRDSRKRSLSDNQFSPRYSNTTSPGVLFALAEVTDNRHRNVGSAVQDPDVITKSPSAAGKPLKIAKTNEKSSCK